MVWIWEHVVLPFFPVTAEVKPKTEAEGTSRLESPPAPYL